MKTGQNSKYDIKKSLRSCTGLIRIKASYVVDLVLSFMVSEKRLTFTANIGPRPTP